MEKVATDKKRVFVSDIIGKPSHVKTCLIVPFANKPFCFDNWLKGIKQLSKDVGLIVYDNTNSEKTRQLIKRGLKGMFSWQIWIRDENQQFTVENAKDYILIDNRMWDIYSETMKYVPKCEYIFIVEDDIEIPDGTYIKFLDLMDLYPQLGTVVGMARDRRKCDNAAYFHAPIIWNILKAEIIPLGEKFIETRQFSEVKDFGVESIGSAHTGCWFTRYEVAKKLKFGTKCDLMFNNYLDQDWGYRVNQAGLVMAVDWSVKCKHYSNYQGKKEYV